MSPDHANVFDLISLETGMFHHVWDDYEDATTGTGRLEALDRGIDHAFAVLELLAGLRRTYPQHAAALIQQWRGTLLRLRDMQAREMAR
jgi:hypothetical protein